MPWGHLHRFPIDPVLDLVESKLALVRATGLAFETLYSPRGLTPRSADRVAIAVKKHPADLWPDWFPAMVEASKCGTTAGYRAHIRAHELACDACLAAERCRGERRRRAAGMQPVCRRMAVAA